MSAKPKFAISMMNVTVPVELPPAKGRRRKADPDDPPHIDIELWGSCMYVWDEAVSMVERACFPFVPDADPRYASMVGNRAMVDLPFLDDVFRFLAGHYAANRKNPVGAFVRPAVEALEAAIAKRDGSSVYFAEAGNRIKIGWSKRVASRVATLQTGNSAPVRLLGTTPGGRALERRLHQEFAHARIAGEWFLPTPELRARIAALAT